MKAIRVLFFLLLILALLALPGDQALGGCAECAQSGDCPAGLLCRESQCVECLLPAECPAGTTCAEGLCIPVPLGRSVWLPLVLQQ
jgi:hypothetical protein